jgi:hypothetical protein
MKYRALPHRVLVTDMQMGERMIGSIILMNDDGRTEGIRSRWAKVYDVGQGVDDVKVGEWILIQHGRWTRGVKIKEGDKEITLWQVEYPDGILFRADAPTETFSGEHIVKAEKLERT